MTPGCGGKCPCCQRNHEMTLWASSPAFAQGFSRGILQHGFVGAQFL